MKRILFNEPECITISDNYKVLRVELSTHYTQIDMGYQPADAQTEIGKIKIPKNTHLLLENDKKKYILTNSDNSAIFKKYQHLKTLTDWLFFSLYFEALPLNTAEFNIVSDGKENGFNFYSVKLNPEKQLEIR